MDERFVLGGVLTDTVILKVLEITKESPVYMTLHVHANKPNAPDETLVRVSKDPMWRCGTTPHGGQRYLVMAMRCEYGSEPREMPDTHRGALRALLVSEPDARARTLLLAECALRSRAKLFYDRRRVVEDPASSVYLYCMWLSSRLSRVRGAPGASLVSPYLLHLFTEALAHDETPVGASIREVLCALDPSGTHRPPARGECASPCATTRAFIEHVVAQCAEERMAPPARVRVECTFTQRAFRTLQRRGDVRAP